MPSALTGKSTVVFAAAAIAASAFTAAHAGASSARVAGPIALGAQVYAGGVVEVREVGGGLLLAVSIDGRRIAILFNDADTRPRDGRANVLAFRRDSTGLVHLVGLRDAEGAEGLARPPALRLATQRRGVTTVAEFAAAAQRQQQTSTPPTPAEAVVRLTQ